METTRIRFLYLLPEDLLEVTKADISADCAIFLISAHHHCNLRRDLSCYSDTSLTNSKLRRNTLSKSGLAPEFGAVAGRIMNYPTSFPRTKDGCGNSNFVNDVIAVYETSANEDPRVRRFLALTMGHLGDKRAVPALLDGLNDPQTSKIKFTRCGHWVRLAIIPQCRAC